MKISSSNINPKVFEKKFLQLFFKDTKFIQKIFYLEINRGSKW